MEEDDDYQLQLALALSLADAQGQDTSAIMEAAAAMAGALPAPGAPAGQPAAPAAAQAQAAAPMQPMGAPAAAAGGGGAQAPVPDLAAILAQALQAGLAAAAGGAAAAPLAAQSAPAAQPAAAAPTPGSIPPRPAAPLARGAAAASSSSARAPSAAPAWVQTLGQWWQPATPAADAEVPEAEFPQALQLLGACLGTPVGCSAVPATVAGPAAAGGLRLVASKGSSGAMVVKPRDMEAMVSTWLVRKRGSGGGSGHLQTIRAAHALATEAASKPSTQGGVSHLLGLMAAALCSKTVQQLVDDEDDLFFESGRHMPELLAALRAPNPNMPPSFLSGLLGAVGGPAEAKAWQAVQTDSFKAFGSYSFSAGVMDLEGLLLQLDTITSQQALVEMMLSRLAADVTNAAATASTAQRGSNIGKAFAANSLLGPLLGLGTVPDLLAVLRNQGVTSMATEVFTTLRGYPSNQGEVAGAKKLLEGCLGRLQGATEQVAKRLLKAKVAGAPAAVGREVLMAWLAAAAASNEVRTAGGEYGVLQHLNQGADDNFMLNCSALLLRLAHPFVRGRLQGSAKFQDLFSQHLDPSYYTTQARRLGSASSSSSLSGQRGVASGAAGAAAMVSWYSAPLLAAEDGGVPSFMADVFFVAQRHLHVGLLPAVARYNKLLSDLHTAAESAAQQAGQARPQVDPQLTLFADTFLAQLLHPEMAAQTVEFVVLELLWLADLLQRGQTQAFDLIPGYVVGDAASWLVFVIRHGQAEMLASVDIGLLMGSLLALLEHPHQVASLLVVSKLVHLLLSMLAPQIDVGRRTMGALGKTYMRPGEAALVAAVLGTRSAREQLVPALMRVYGQADFVVGLDVDKDSYDKFNVRHEIDLLLLELWRDSHCRDCIRQQATAGDGSVFGDFVSAVLNDLIYLFKDSLERLADIHQIERSKADAKAWGALSAQDRQEKDQFYWSQARTARGFMGLAVTTIQLLNTLTGDDAVVRPFLSQPLSGRAAYALLHFLELLVGPRCQQLAVDKPRQYQFDKDALLLSLVQMLVQLGRHSEFRRALAEDQDFDARLLHTALDLLNTNHQYGAAQGLSGLLEALPGVTGPAAKRPRGDAAAGAAAGAAGGSDAAGGSGDVDMEEPPGDDVAAVAASLLLPGPTTFDAAETEYAEQLGPLAMGEFDASVPGSYNSHFAAMSAAAEGDTQQKMRRLGKELRDLRGKQRLPVGAAAAHFVRQDLERPDKVRAIITGPEGTPYEGGLFLFDVYFPAGYPMVPPLMVLETTGEGRARFNPNLYADGKVCLSLLGTWHGGDEASKWNPTGSSLYQILLSIQGMILVQDPYFNEPSVDLMRGKAEGEVSSKRYNAQVRLDTLRYAMIAQLKKPPAGFETVVAAHFRVLRPVLLARMGRWLTEAAAADGAMYSRMVAAARELRELLVAL